jgi:hypothetical protein
VISNGDLGSWHDVPSEQVRSWRGLFDASVEGLNLAVECPLCRSRSLHRWFDLSRAETAVPREPVLAG